MLKNNPVMFAQLVLKIIAQCCVLFLHTLVVEILAIFFEKIIPFFILSNSTKNPQKFRSYWLKPGYYRIQKIALAWMFMTTVQAVFKPGLHCEYCGVPISWPPEVDRYPLSQLAQRKNQRVTKKKSLAKAEICWPPVAPAQKFIQDGPANETRRVGNLVVYVMK